MEPSELIAFPQCDEYRITTLPGFKGHTISIEEDFLNKKAVQLGLPAVDEIIAKEQRMLRSPDIQTNFLSNLIISNIEFIKENLEVINQQRFREQIDSLMTENLLITLDCSKEKRRHYHPTNRERVVNRAKLYINDCQGDYISISTLCEAVNASWRTLDYAFKSMLGVTPKQYLQAYRFRKARSALLKAPADQKIADIANDYGFWHIGQFSSDYRKYFGELPSQTLNSNHH